jgi:hypothetical protein
MTSAVLAEAARRMMSRSVMTSTGCVEWLGCVNSKGYGVISLAGQRVLTHRLAYEHYVGPIGDDLTVDHLCLNKSCVNVGHMELVTRVENSRRSNVDAPRRRPVCERGHFRCGGNAASVVEQCTKCTKEDRRSRRRASSPLVVVAPPSDAALPGQPAGRTTSTTNK